MPGLPQYAPIRSARSNREASGRGAARRGGAGPRASRSQGRALPLRYEPQLRGHLTDHQGVWHQAGGPCSLRPKRAALRRLLPLGILDPHEVTRRSLLLRPATCSGQDSQPGATSDRESPGRDPSWLSEAWGGLSGGCCLAQSGVARRLTDADVGYLAPPGRSAARTRRELLAKRRPEPRPDPNVPEPGREPRAFGVQARAGRGAEPSEGLDHHLTLFGLRPRPDDPAVGPH